MKKIILSMSLFALVMASCSKEQTCECTSSSTDSDGVTTAGTPQTTVYTKISSKDMKKVCQTVSSVDVYTDAAGATETTKNSQTCTIK